MAKASTTTETPVATETPVQSAPLTTGDIAAVVGDIQLERQQKGELPLTGVELAAQIGAMQPAAAPPGTRYQITERTAPDTAPAIVKSGDGTPEDAVRAYNNGRTNIRTAKQLIITRIAG